MVDLPAFPAPTVIMTVGAQPSCQSMWREEAALLDVYLAHSSTLTDRANRPMMDYQPRPGFIAVPTVLLLLPGYNNGKMEFRLAPTHK